MRIERLSAEWTGLVDLPSGFELIEHWRARDDAGRDLAVMRLWQWGEHTVATFDVLDLSATRGVRLLLAIRRWLETRGEPIYSPVDSKAFPAAERLNRVLGFVPSDLYVGTDGGATRLMEVWQWQRQ